MTNKKQLKLINQAYNQLDLRNYKKALKITNDVTISSMPLALALQSICRAQLGDFVEANRILESLLSDNDNSLDEDIVAACKVTAQLLRRGDILVDIASRFAPATVRSAVLYRLASAYEVDDALYEMLQQHAMKFDKQSPATIAWTMLVRYKHAMSQGIHQNAKIKLIPILAERFLSKIEKKSAQEWTLLGEIMEVSGKVSNFVQLLEECDVTTSSSDNNRVFLTSVSRLELIGKYALIDQNSQLAYDSFTLLLSENPENYAYFKGLLSSLELSRDLCTLELYTKFSSWKSRSAQLFLIELSILLNDSDKIFKSIKCYFENFCSKPSCFSDLEKFSFYLRQMENYFEENADRTASLKILLLLNRKNNEKRKELEECVRERCQTNTQNEDAQMLLVDVTRLDENISALKMFDSPASKIINIMENPTQYKYLNLKYIQWDSCSYFISRMLYQQLEVKHLLEVSSNVFNAHNGCLTALPDNIEKALRAGNYWNASDFLSFQRGKIMTSLALLNAKLSVILAAPLERVENIGKFQENFNMAELLSKQENGFNMNCATSLFGLDIDALNISDNRDISIFDFLLCRDEIFKKFDIFEHQQDIVHKAYRAKNIYMVIISSLKYTSEKQLRKSKSSAERVHELCELLGQEDAVIKAIAKAMVSCQPPDSDILQDHFQSKTLSPSDNICFTIVPVVILLTCLQKLKINAAGYCDVMSKYLNNIIDSGEFVGNIDMIHNLLIVVKNLS